MKNLILFASLLATLLITSCTKDAQLGTGNFINEERNTKIFDGVEVTGNLEVHLIQSNQFRVKVESYENLMPYVETFVSNGVLQVRMANGFQDGGNETVVWVYAPSVYEIDLNGSGYVVTDNYHNFKDYLEVNLQGSGDITIRGTARTTDVTLYGSGTIRLDGSTSNLTIENSGSGDVRAYDFTKLMCGVIWMLKLLAVAILFMKAILEFWHLNRGRGLFAGDKSTNCYA
jgi:hypothetical protein